MNEIKKAKCCGTCKHWISGIDDCLGECLNPPIVEIDTQIYEVCDKHEWSEDE